MVEVLIFLAKTSYLFIINVKNASGYFRSKLKYEQFIHFFFLCISEGLLHNVEAFLFCFVFFFCLVLILFFWLVVYVGFESFVVIPTQENTFSSLFCARSTSWGFYTLCSLAFPSLLFIMTVL